jgi:hypothetical protein
MDQLKPVLAAIKKHYFWIVMVIVLGTSLTFFYLSNSKLNSDIADRISSVDSSYSVINDVRNKVSTHPNKSSEEQMEAVINVHKKDVQDAWATQYERQKVYLKWPKGVTADDALAKLDKMRPIELTVPNPMTEKDDPLAGTYRERYRDYITRVFPEIAGTIGASWTASLTGPPTPPTITNPVVKWEEASQVKLIKQIAPWYDPKKPPSTLDILYTQEDLWILSGLMNIIKSVNGDARENFQAAIKEIKWIRIGSTANGAAGKIKDFKGPVGGGGPGGPGGASSPYGAQGPSSAPSSPSSGGAYGGAYGGGAAVVSLDPANNRYVTSDFKPVSSADLISKMKSRTPDAAYFAVAKRVPIQMRLSIDQRKVADLIAACGNNDLVIEIKQLRYGGEESKEGATESAMAAPGASSGGAVGASYGSGYGAAQASGPSGGPGASYGTSGGYGNAYGGGAGDSNIKWNDKGYELDVELYGIVVLYNPVDIEQLGIEKVDQSTKLETTSDATSTAPAAPAPAPAPVDSTTPATPAGEQPSPQPAGNQPPVVPTTPTPGTEPVAAPPGGAEPTNTPPVATPPDPNAPAPVPAATESAANVPRTTVAATGN